MMTIIAGFLFVILLILLLVLQNPMAVIGILIPVPMFIISQLNFKKLSISFKEHYIQPEIEKWIEKAVYQPKEGLSKEFVYGSGVLKKEDRFSSEDYLEGMIKNRKFISADVHLQDVRSNGKSTTVVTVFQGRFFEIEFDKKFEHDVYIFPNFLHRFSLGRGLEQIDVESIIFNKKFDVFSKDQQSAFYLLKPRFIEKLLEFHEIHKRVFYGFKDNKVYIAIDTRKDAFDLKMFKAIDENYFKEIKQEIKLIEELIELITN
jgi:hypothetical protein